MDEPAKAKPRVASAAMKRRDRLPLLLAVLTLLSIVGLALGWATWLSAAATSIKKDLEAASDLIPTLKQSIGSNDSENATATVEELQRYTRDALSNTKQPLWSLATSIPVLGANFSAISEVSQAANDVSTLGLAPMVGVSDSLKWDSLMPSGSGADLEPLSEAAPSIIAAAHAVDMSADRLNRIDTGPLLPQVAKPIDEVRIQMSTATHALSTAAQATRVLPGMLGSEGRRQYLLMIQNNAESRASGGIPGALAVLSLNEGKLSLDAQSSAGDVGTMVPVVGVDPQQEQIYSTRLGKYMQDVNLTPDFPTAASTAKAMWEKKTGQRVDGVISIDPIVLSYILQSTGPVALKGPELSAVKAAGLPTELTGSNVVPTLLSDVYAKIQQPKLQDAYFAGVAKEVFAALSSGKGEAKGLVAGIARGTEEGRVLVWSADSFEQSIISQYPLSGSISGPSVSPAQFGVYFNDGTGAKMDYYIRRTVQIIKECPVDGYQQTSIRVTSTNTAPADAATSFPAYVTGGGAYGVTPGTVQTNIVAYGPVQANVESAVADGKKVPFAPYRHANRPVGVVAQQLVPGESKTIDFTFGKIVQHTEPNLVVTPTVQHVKDVILPTENTSCDQGQ